MKNLFADISRDSLNAADIAVGDELKPMDIELTHTIVTATAIASMDFMPVHHDKDFALSQFAPDAFLNILSTNGFVSKFLTDWAGPSTWVKNISIKLGVPAVPHQILRFSGQVLEKNQLGDKVEIKVSVLAANDSGNHATGSAIIVLPGISLET